jgi:Fe-S-cluster containining protein
MISNLKQFVPSAVCLACDGCCRFSDEQSQWRPKIAEEEIRQLENDSTGQNSFSRACVDEGSGLKAQFSGDQCVCAFLCPERNTCRIYSLRPFECQLYPFVLVKRGNKAVVAVHRHCPHIQKKYGSRELERYTIYLKGFFQRSEVMPFIRANPHLVGDYRGYEDELTTMFPLT